MFVRVIHSLLIVIAGWEECSGRRQPFYCVWGYFRKNISGRYLNSVLSLINLASGTTCTITSLSNARRMTNCIGYQFRNLFGQATRPPGESLAEPWTVPRNAQNPTRRLCVFSAQPCNLRSPQPRTCTIRYINSGNIRHVFFCFFASPTFLLSCQALLLVARSMSPMARLRFGCCVWLNQNGNCFPVNPWQSKLSTIHNRNVHNPTHARSNIRASPETYPSMDALTRSDLLFL